MVLSFLFSVTATGLSKNRNTCKNKYPPVKQAVLVTPYKGSLLTAPKGAFLIDRQPYLFFNLV
ncbi:hypothetical protein, partial [Lysinibacillus halotolerans]|uniref:hypothetical protein n=1 Tax=Lysinibacillus halotolerans TaxID=1368476 RepID=UPI0019D4A4B9